MFESLLCNREIWLRVARPIKTILSSMQDAVGRICRNHQLVSFDWFPCLSDPMTWIVRMTFSAPAVPHESAHEIYGAGDFDATLAAIEPYEIIDRQVMFPDSDTPLLVLRGDD